MNDDDETTTTMTMNLDEPIDDHDFHVACVDRRLSVVNPSSAVRWLAERRSTARQIQSKSTEFVCPSSARPLSAGSEQRSTVRQIQSKSTEFVCLSSTRPLSTWLGTALDGQTDCVKTNRIRLSVVNPSSAVRWLGTALDGQTDSVKKYRIRLSVVSPSAVRWLGSALDGQTDSFKTNRIRLSVVTPFALLDYVCNSKTPPLPATTTTCHIQPAAGRCRVGE
jgi:hypothetical protein